MKKLFAVLLLIVLVMSSFSSVSANNDEAITRGDFFNLIVKHLGYENGNDEVELPTDIPATSPYAEAAKILKAKKIVAGYGDGTFRPNQNISVQEASSIIARIIVVNDDNAMKTLADEYGITLENENELSLEKAQELVTKTLSSDEDALDILDQMTAAHNSQNSYQADADISMELKMVEGAPDDLAELTDGLALNMKSAITYHKEKGLHQQIKTALPNPLTNEQLEMTMDQYFVPEGIFMRISDPLSGEEQWVDMSASMPFSFEELLSMNEDSMNIASDLNKKYFIYRNLGMEEVDGSSHHKLGFTGKITSLQEITEILNSVFQDQSEAILSSLEVLPDIEMVMTGYMLIDEETLLPTKQTVDYELTYGKAVDPAMEMPIDSIRYKMDFTYYNFNNAGEIVLPEEAKKAEKMPSLEELLETPAE